jgi:hypothetical protein
VSVDAQSATSGASVTPAASVVTVSPGGTVDLPVVASAAAGSPRGDDYGFIVLTRGTDQVRIPYYFTVSQPQLVHAPVSRLERTLDGSTAKGADLVDVYRFPAFPFGPPPDYTGPGMIENGAEHVYPVHISSHVANAGAAVIAEGQNALVEPWLLGSLNEDDVQGYPGTPVNVNGLTYEYEFDNGAAALDFPHEGRYYIVVDSQGDPYTGEPLRGPYLVHTWLNDVKPPRLRFLTTRVAAGRPLLAAFVSDKGAGVDPLSLVVGYKGVLLLAAFYDPSSGLAVWLLDGAPTIGRGKTRITVVASDYQESKNVDQAGSNVLPNSVFRQLRLRGVTGPVVTWLLPQRNACAARREGLLVTAGASRGIKSVAFYVGHRRISKQSGGLDLFSATWRTAKAHRGRHVLRAVVTDRRGHRAQARRIVRVCRR